MSEISVKYADIAHGSDTSNVLHTKLDEVSSNIKTETAKLSEDIFMGPIAENTKEATESLSKQMSEAIDGVKVVHDLLNQVNEKYKAQDLSSIDAILNIENPSSILGTAAGLETYRQLASMLVSGRFDKGNFQATNGTNLKYYVYVPQFSDGEKTGLPMCVFLHGSGGKRHALTETFPTAVKNGMNVPGILLFPQSSKGWSNSSSSVTAAGELTRKVAKQYKVDMTRISAAGHSDGGYGVHELVSKNPDLFSCYLCYDGGKSKGSNLSVIEKNKIPSWGFIGSKGVYKKQESSIYNELESANPDITQYTVIKGQGHSIKYSFWTTKYNFNGKSYTPLEWLLTTKKAK